MSRVPREAWYAGTPLADGTLMLAPWMAISCATPSRTSQTSARTIRGLFGSHAARARNVGSGWGLSVEEMRTILNPTGAALGTGVTIGGAPLIVDPSGTHMASQIDYDGSDAPGSIHIDATYLTPSVLNDRYANSAWQRTPAQPLVISGAFPPGAPVLVTEKFDWSQYSTGTIGDGVTPLGTQLASPPATNLPFTLYNAFSQVEQGGLYPTSFLATGGGVRDADILRVDPTVALVNGFYDFSLVIAPNWDSIERLPAAFLMRFDATHYVYYQPADQKVYINDGFSAYGGVGPLVFDRNQQLRISARSTANGRRVSVDGATSGNGEIADPNAAAPIPPTADTWCLGDGTNSSSIDLRAVEFYQPGG